MPETQNVFWTRIKPVRPAGDAPQTRDRNRAGRIRILLGGFLYVALFTAVLFAEVYVQTRMKSYSLGVWMLERKKVELENEITRLDMRLTILESPMRIETLALSEMGLTAVESQKEKPARKP